VLLYDLTSTYFECDPPGDGKRKFGYSRDKSSDCVQVVIALIVTPDGFPLAYEVMDGNTSDKTTLREFLAKLEKQYGKAKRTWVMDRGIPTEEVLAEMRNSKTPIHYLVGSPRGRLTQLEKAFVTKPWVRSQRRPTRQGAIDAAAAVEKTDQAPARANLGPEKSSACRDQTPEKS
jgi:transposase